MRLARPTIDETLMAIAKVWEDRSTCGRNHVGAVIAKDGRHIGSGYNGAPAGMPHCEHGVHTFDPIPSVFTKYEQRDDPGCKLSVHAEANALSYCARFGIAVEGSTIYTTLSPCYTCSQLIISAGLVRVAYIREYRDRAGIELLRTAGVLVDYLGR